MATEPVIELSGVSKTFTMHLQGGARVPVVRDASFTVTAGTCAVLSGPSGTGKSSILKMIFGSYRCDSGTILIADAGERVDVASASPRRIVRLRAGTLGYVSQFLRTIPRVSARDIVASHARSGGLAADAATDRAEDLLARLNIPPHLRGLPPATFSGGEQQRVNIACGFAAPRRVLLLDEPTASLDATNRAIVVSLIREARTAGSAILGIFHDADVRREVADTLIDVTRFSPSGAAP